MQYLAATGKIGVRRGPPRHSCKVEAVKPLRIADRRRRAGLLARAWLPGSFDHVAIAAVLLLIFAAAALPSAQSDTWWQLRTGQLIVQTGSIPTTDPFSSTVRGGPWPNHEWLAEVLFYLAYALGGLPALFALCAGLIVLAWGGLALVCEGPGRVRAAALLLGATSQAALWSARPHLFSLALLAAALGLVPRRRLHWLYPALFLLWANLHAGVAFGGALLAAATLVAFARDWRDWRGWRRSDGARWALIVLASGLATLANPLGIGLWRYVLASFGDTTRAYLTEWQPPSLGWPASYPFFMLLGMCVAAVVVARASWRGQRDWTLLAVALVFGLLGLRSIRHTAFLPLVAAPLLTRPLRDWPALAARGGRRGLAHLALLLVVAAGAGLAVLRAWASTPPVPLGPAIVAAVRGCDGVLYNTYDAGGLLIWAVPERPVFVDNRQDPYPADLLFRAVLAEQRGEYQALFGEYGVRCALVPAGQPLYVALRRDGWAELGRDAQLAVLEKKPDSR